MSVEIDLGYLTEKYRQKYKDIKKRIHDIEEDNDILNVRLHKARKNIGRLRLERTFLLERIEKSRDHFDGDSEDSDGISDIISHNEFDLHHSHSAHRKPAIRMFDKPQRRKKDPNAPKGPGNVFFLYCRLERDKIKDQYPNENLGDVTKLLGQKWKSLTKDEKQKYYDMYKKEQEEYEAAMKSYNKENPNTSYIRESSPPVSHTSPLPADDLNSTSSFHGISSRDHGVEMALNSSQQGSSLLDEDEDLMEPEPLPTQYQASTHDMDGASDELVEDEDSTDYQAYHSHFSPKHSNPLPRDFQDQSKFAAVEDSASASSTK
ncbi:non-histone protein [Umbelopsis sp. WA50703]